MGSSLTRQMSEFEERKRSELHCVRARVWLCVRTLSIRVLAELVWICMTIKHVCMDAASGFPCGPLHAQSQTGFWLICKNPNQKNNCINEWSGFSTQTFKGPFYISLMKKRKKNILRTFLALVFQVSNSFKGVLQNNLYFANNYGAVVVSLTQTLTNNFLTSFIYFF